MSMSFCNINPVRLVLLSLLSLIPYVAEAQGNSIPTSTAVQEQRAVQSILQGELPEGVKYRYPLLNGMSVSANIFPIVIDLFGKDYGNYEGSLTLDLHHRFFPQATVGAGYCKAQSKDVGYTPDQSGDNKGFVGLKYHCKMRPYFKAGLLYNFNYNDLKPNDFYGAVLRFAYAYSEADVENLGYADAVWGNVGPMKIEGLKFHSVWMELGGFIKVEVARHFSLGWDLTYRPFLHRGKDRQGKPYFVPGYGTASSRFGLNFNIYYDL